MASRWICLDDKDIDLLRAVLGMGNSDYEHRMAIRAKLERSQKRITTASAKGKGRELQQWVCKQISVLLGIPYDQQDDSCLIHSREMGQAGKDVILRGEAQKRFPFAIECKSTETFNIRDTIRQARANQNAGEDWLIVYRSKVIREPVAIMDFATFIKYWRG